MSGGCDRTLSHWLSAPLGIPLANLGLIVYLAIGGLVVLAGFGQEGRSRFYSRSALRIAAALAISSLTLTAYSIFVLQSICLWCLSNAAISLLAWVAVSIANTSIRASPFADQHGGQFLIASLSLCTCGLLFFSFRFRPSPPSIDEAALRLATDQELFAKDAVSWGDPRADTSILAFINLHCGSCAQALAIINAATAESKARVFVCLVPVPKSGVSMEAATLALVAQRRGFGRAFIERAMAGDLSSRDINIAFRQVTGGPGSSEEEKRSAQLALQRDINLGRRLGVHQTPTVVLQLRTHRRLVASVRELAALIRSEEAR